MLLYDHTYVIQEVGCRCTLLAGNSSISFAGSEEQIHFSQQSSKMLKMASESFIHALLLVLGLFPKISRLFPIFLLMVVTLFFVLLYCEMVVDV